MSNKEKEKEVEQQKGKYVTFQSGNEFFGIKIQYVNSFPGVQ